MIPRNNRNNRNNFRTLITLPQSNNEEKNYNENIQKKSLITLEPQIIRINDTVGCSKVQKLKANKAVNPNLATIKTFKTRIRLINHAKCF